LNWGLRADVHFSLWWFKHKISASNKKGSAISDPAKITASQGAVIQREDARTPKKPLKCRPNIPFKNITFGGLNPSHGLFVFIEVG
jgi:hypothetical protein